MAIEYDKNDVGGGYNLAKLNDNFDKIETALQDGLSRSGNGPNQMEADFDLNGNDILNAKSIDVDELYVGGIKATPSELVDTTNFATAVQGAKADTAYGLAITALQPATGKTEFLDVAAATAANIPLVVVAIGVQCYKSSESTSRGKSEYRLAVDDTEYNAFPSGLRFTTVNGRKFVAYNLANSSQAGVIGDGVNDDWARLQAYADYCAYTGRDFILDDNPKEYLISQKIVFKVQRQLAPADTTPMTDVHFTDDLPFYIRGVGKAWIRATSSMTTMFEIIFNTAKANLGPFYSKVEGIQFNGDNLATSGIVSNYVMHSSYMRNRFVNLTRGIEYTGYGGFVAEKNVFRCKYGLYLVGGGGDSTIVSNDFYSQENSSAGVYLGYYGGNMVIDKNIFTNEGNYSNAYCVQGDGGTAPASQEIRHVRVLNNEFCGYPTAIRADGKNSGVKNVWNWIITHNHVTPFGANSYGKLLHAVDCRDFIVRDNELNSKELIDASDNGIFLLRCDRFNIDDNKFANFSIAAVYDQDGVDNVWRNNTFDDIGKLGSSYTCVDKYGTGLVRFEYNIFRQSSASYAQNGIYERDSANNTIMLDNSFRGMTNGQRKAASGTASIIVRTVYDTAAPTSGTWNIGDRTINTNPTAGGTSEWRCVTAGSPGTWKAVSVAA